MAGKLVGLVVDRHGYHLHHINIVLRLLYYHILILLSHNITLSPATAPQAFLAASATATSQHKPSACTREQPQLCATVCRPTAPAISRQPRVSARISRFVVCVGCTHALCARVVRQ